MMSMPENTSWKEISTTVLYESGFLVLGSFAVLLAWTTSIYMHLEYPAVGLGLAFSALMIIMSYDKKIYSNEVSTSIYVTRFVVASSLNAAALAICGFRTLAGGPGAPLRRGNRSRWFDAYGKRDRYGPMIESYTGILCILAYVRSMEYLIILGSRLGTKMKDALFSDHQN